MDAADLQELLLEIQHSSVEYRHDPNDEWRNGECKSIKVGTGYMTSSTMKVSIDLANSNKVVSVPLDPQWVRFEGVSDDRQEEFEDELTKKQYYRDIASALSNNKISNEQYETLNESKFVNRYKNEAPMTNDEVAQLIEDGLSEREEQNDSSSEENNEQIEERDFLMDVQVIIKLDTQKWVGLDPAGKITTNIESKKSEITERYDIESTTGIGDGVYYCLPQSAEQIGINKEDIADQLD